MIDLLPHLPLRSSQVAIRRPARLRLWGVATRGGCLSLAGETPVSSAEIDMMFVVFVVGGDQVEARATWPCNAFYWTLSRFPRVQVACAAQSKAEAVVSARVARPVASVCLPGNPATSGAVESCPLPTAPTITAVRNRNDPANRTTCNIGAARWRIHLIIVPAPSNGVPLPRFFIGSLASRTSAEDQRRVPLAADSDPRPSPGRSVQFLLE